MSKWKRPSWAIDGVAYLEKVVLDALRLPRPYSCAFHDEFNRRTGYRIVRAGIFLPGSATDHLYGAAWSSSDPESFHVVCAMQDVVIASDDPELCSTRVLKLKKMLRCQLVDIHPWEPEPPGETQYGPKTYRLANNLRVRSTLVPKATQKRLLATVVGLAASGSAVFEEVDDERSDRQRRRKA